jgi:hypothetical protein
VVSRSPFFILALLTVLVAVLRQTRFGAPPYPLLDSVRPREKLVPWCFVLLGFGHGVLASTFVAPLLVVHL